MPITDPLALPARLRSWIKDPAPAATERLLTLVTPMSAEARRRTLEKALRRERAGGPGYDVARHRAVLRALRGNEGKDRVDSGRGGRSC